MTDNALLAMCSWNCNGRAPGGRARGSVCKPRVLTADSTLISWFKKRLEILLGDLKVASEEL